MHISGADRDRHVTAAAIESVEFGRSGEKEIIREADALDECRQPGIAVPNNR